MAISDIQPKQGNIEVTGEVIEKGDVREFEKFGKQGRVCNGKLKDQTGEITLSLWNEQIDTVNVGDMIKISNGWCSEWQGEKQLTTGKFGTLEVVGKSEGAGSESASDAAPAGESTPAPEPSAPVSDAPADDTAVSGDELKDSVDEEEVI